MVRISQTKWILIGSVAVTAALYFIPFGRTLAYPLILISTLAHEMGHGLMALAVGSNFHSLQMWSDGSGVAAISGHTGRMGDALISAGGLVGPPIVAAILFVVASRESLARLSLTMLGAALIVVEFMFVRNFFGWVFVGVLAGLFLWLGQQSRAWLAQNVLVLVAVQLALSVFSRMDYLFTPTAQTAQGPMPSDVAQISEALLLPFWFWGGLCALFSVVTLFFGLKSYLRK